MKRSAFGLALGVALSMACAPAALAQDEGDELARARFLDQQGVRAFAEARYRDAIALFDASYRAGGPATELWNVARCQLKLEEQSAARKTLEEYLSQNTLSPQDRAEAQRLLDELVHRTSPLVVASTPAGALVMVDGHVWGMTPYLGTLPAGEHTIKVGSSSHHVEAQGGRTVVVSVALGAGDRGRSRKKHGARDTPRFFAEVDALATVSSLGGALVSVMPAPEIALGWAPFHFARGRVGFGARFRAEYDAWSTSAGVSNANTLGCTTGTDFSAVELLAMPTVFADWYASRSVWLGARIGFGAAIYISGSPIAGDVFAPECAYGGSLAPDGYASLDVSVRLSEQFRLIFPATLDVHTAYVGARSDGVVDATGPWLRVGLGVALAVDL